MLKNKKVMMSRNQKDTEHGGKGQGRLELCGLVGAANRSHLSREAIPKKALRS